MQVEQALPERIDFVEARVQLQSNGTLQAAMEQALVAATGSAQSGGAATAAARQAVRNAARESIEDGRPAVIERGPMGRLAPLSAANLSALQADQGLIRIFFASGSRAIVAPDDGLGVLLRDAPRADRVRITGFTDSQGDRASNLALARSRADAIAQILLRRGVDPMRIELDAVETAPIRGNPVWLAMLLRNLVDNAAKASKEGGKIWIRADERELSVRDEGKGIPLEDLARVTEAFYMVDKARARSAGSVGLGLAICRAIVDAHDGTIAAGNRSQRPQGGACVTFTLPLGKPPIIEEELLLDEGEAK